VKEAEDPAQAILVRRKQILTLAALDRRDEGLGQRSREPAFLEADWQEPTLGLVGEDPLLVEEAIGVTFLRCERQARQQKSHAPIRSLIWSFQSPASFSSSPIHGSISGRRRSAENRRA